MADFRERESQTRDLVLALGEYAYIQDTTKGTVKTHVGPTVVSQTGQQRPVYYEPGTGRFIECSLEKAVRQWPKAREGEYLILENPAKDTGHPTNGDQSFELLEGRKIIVSGPATFPLWPGQSARVISGHKLASNEYLIVRVYNQEEARKNWTSAEVVKATDDTEEEVTISAKVGKTLKMGQRIIIQGTEVSFYIPPTGIEVVPEGENTDRYVRAAVTLERLEYCILVDEDGNKRYPRGPMVVFPEATEAFIEDSKNNRKFRAIELNNIQGIHVKVIQPYKENSVSYEEGEEIFITGKEQAIYYPRQEHSVIQYGKGNRKHYAISIPKGEARYVLDRETGDVVAMAGPQMLLPDPRKYVVVRRPLSSQECLLWYPGNSSAAAYNDFLRGLTTSSAPSARSGFISEGDYRKESDAPSMMLFDAEDVPIAAASVKRSRSGEAHTPGEFTRGTTYTPPRTITLDTKYDGVPSIRVWTGYAICVVDKSGGRRIVVGPQTILLEYDETLEVFYLSTGKPKTTDNIKKEVYLRCKNNYITDIIAAETSDHVEIELKLSYRCNFLDEYKDKWFDVENYVKALCDHSRSILKGAIKKQKAEDFYANPSTIIRDSVLGKKPESSDSRTGLLFKENGLHVWDVEVLSVRLKDDEIAKLLGNAQHDVVRDTLHINTAKRKLDLTLEGERIARETAEAKNSTFAHQLEIEKLQIQAKLEKDLGTIAADAKKLAEDRKNVALKEEVANFTAEQALVRQKLAEQLKLEMEKERQQLAVELLEKKSGTVVQQIQAADKSFGEAIVALGRDHVAAEVAKAMSIPGLLGGENLIDTLNQIPVLNPLVERFTKQDPSRLTARK